MDIKSSTRMHLPEDPGNVIKEFCYFCENLKKRINEDGCEDIMESDWSDRVNR